MKLPPTGPQRNPSIENEGRYLAEVIRYMEDSAGWNSMLFFELYEAWKDKQRRLEEPPWWD